MALTELTPVERDVYAALEACIPQGVSLQLPPRIAEALPLRFAGYEPGASLTLNAVADPRYANPMGVYQGGILTAVMDVGFGTLSMLAERAPCVSVTMEVTFLRPMMANGQEFEVRIRVRARMKSMVFLEAEVVTLDGKQIAAASSAMSVYRVK